MTDTTKNKFIELITSNKELVEKVLKASEPFIEYPLYAYLCFSSVEFELLWEQQANENILKAIVREFIIAFNLKENLIVGDSSMLVVRLSNSNRQEENIVFIPKKFEGEEVLLSKNNTCYEAYLNEIYVGTYFAILSSTKNIILRRYYRLLFLQEVNKVVTYINSQTTNISRTMLDTSKVIPSDIPYYERSTVYIPK